MESQNINISKKENRNIFKSLLVKLGLGHYNVDKKIDEANIPTDSTNHGTSVITRPVSLADYYKPLNYYEDNRLIKLKEAVELLEKFQLAAAHYCINKNELACEYLLKARYREERENFFHSIQVESYNHSNFE